MKDKGVTEAVYSSTTSAKEDVKYREVYSEIASALSAFPPELFKPYLWFVPSYINEGLTVQKAFADMPYKGIKLHPLANNWDFADKKHEQCLHETFAFAQEKGAPILIHSGPNGVDAPDRFALFFDTYPEAKVTLAHCRPIEEAIAVLKKYPNVHGDTSFVPEEWIHLLVENGLGSKIITGSDFPITHYWATHYQNKKNITLEEQYQEDIETMRKFKTLLAA